MRSNQQLIVEEELERVHFFETMHKHAVEAPAIHCIKGTLEGSPDAVKASSIAAGAHVKLGKGAILLNCTIDEGAELEVGANSTLINVHLYPKVRLHVGKDCMLDDVCIDIAVGSDRCVYPLQLGDKVKMLATWVMLYPEQAHLALADNCTLIGMNVTQAGDLRVGKNTTMLHMQLKTSSCSTLQIGEGCVFVSPHLLCKQQSGNIYRKLIDCLLHLSCVDIGALCNYSGLVVLQSVGNVASFGDGTYFQGGVRATSSVELSTGRNTQLITGEFYVDLLDHSIIRVAEDATLCLLISTVECSAFGDIKAGRKVPSIVVNKGRTLVLEERSRAHDVEV